MHNYQIRAFSLATATALVLAALPAMSEARTTPGSIGRGANEADDTCLVLSNSSIINSCAHPVRVDFPRIHDSSGTLTEQVRAQGPVNSVDCQLVWWDGISIGVSATGSLTSTNIQLISLTVAGSLTTDSVYVGCTLQQNGTVHTLIY